MPDKIEIMSPAGSFESLSAAIKAGADSIYFGVQQLNMRSRSSINFTLADIKKIVGICKKNKVKAYLALNTIMYDHDINLMKDICKEAKKAGISALIISDVAAMQYAKELGVEVHISTQANVSNFESVKFYSMFADVVVLARELTLVQVKKITGLIKKEKIKGPSGKLLRIELFAHGAMCVAVSGKCYMSLATHNSSANRGACKQNCRKSYKVTDNETGEELVIDNEYVMSPKDMCTIGFIDKILDSGVSVLKLEGRGRSPDYIYAVTKCYREAADSYIDGTYSKKKVEAWLSELKKVYNRGFWNGYYLGKKLDIWSGAAGNASDSEKMYIGKALNYYKKSGIALFLIEADRIESGEEVLITGPTTGVVKAKAEKIQVDEKEAKFAEKGNLVTFKVPETIRKNDKLYAIRDRKGKK